MAKGFLPVRVELPDPLPTILLVPELLSLSLIILFAIAPPVYPFSLSFAPDPLLVLEADELVLVKVLSCDGPFILISGYKRASNLNCSMLYKVSLIFSFGKRGSLEMYSLSTMKNCFFWLALMMFLMMFSEF